MEKQEISNTNVDWISLFRHVARDQVSVEITDGPTMLAEVVPKREQLVTRDLASLMASLPSLGDDLDSFAKDVEDCRRDFGKDDDPSEL